MHPFTTAYRLTKEEVQKPESNKILKYIWDQIKKDVKWEETDFNGENIAFRLLDIKAECQQHLYLCLQLLQANLFFSILHMSYCCLVLFQDLFFYP